MDAARGEPGPDATPAPAREVYTHQGNRAFESTLIARTAAREAAFFLPHLRPGMQVLDVGCGPGTITLGMAEVVDPGAVIGADLQATQIEQARARAIERGVGNARFEVANVYALPFPDGSFDAALAHVVLMHLREPVRALREIRRVLRPYGVVGVRDVDWGGSLFVPETSLLERWRSVLVRVRQHNGGDPFMGRYHRRLLLEAGFARAEATASVLSAGSPEETRRHAAFLRAQLQGFATTSMTEGWADQAMLDAVVTDIDAWAERPDAFLVQVYCEAVGWVGG